MRGPDVRDSFLECFHEQLIDARISPFLDSGEIEYGDCIKDKIVEAIKGSYICVPVFSQNFADSPACLMEVDQMVESGKTILPIFYGVEPCVVRHQLGTYEQSFIKHVINNRYPKSKIEKWKAALRMIPEVRGPVFKNVSSGYHKHLRNFIGNLWNRLKLNERDDTENLVGIDKHVQDMMQKLGFSYQDGRVVEQEITGRWVLTVWGMSGVGKTTLARVVYDKIRHLFQGSCFLENVKDEIEHKRLVSLQNRLIRGLKRGGTHLEEESSNDGTRTIQKRFKTSKVLIVLDDVDDYDQIKPLAELTWFGLRSRIILTTTKRNVYKSKNEDILYDPEHEIGVMENEYALELFRKRAFGKNLPPQGFDEMSREIVSVVENLPFAIDFLGTYLYRESEEKWWRTLGELKVKLKGKVKIMLEANYRLLSDEAKEVFLDIACFFTGVEKTMPCYLWAEHSQDSGVDELQEKSFIKLGKNEKFSMHSQLKFLGRGIVEKENLGNPRERSRLWDKKDVETILGKKEKNSKIKALRVAPEINQVDGEEFCCLPELRFLELDNVDINGNPEDLLPGLVWLDWRGCYDKSKLFAFKMEKLVILNLCSSSVKLTSKEWEQLMKKAGSLKVLNLKGCNWINASMKFPASEHLKCLILEGCLLITPTIHDSISRFGKLVSLNMSHCKYFKKLPQALCSMEELKELLIDGTRIEILCFEGVLPALELLSARKCEILREVTDSIGLLTNLRKLTFRSSKKLGELPPAIGKLVLLKEMDLSKTNINELPGCVQNCKKLQVLKMVRTFLEEFPEAIKDLKELKELDLTLCRSLRGCCDITGLSSLKILRLKGTGISELLPRDRRQFCFHTLELDNGAVEQTQDQ